MQHAGNRRAISGTSKDCHDMRENQPGICPAHLQAYLRAHRVQVRVCSRQWRKKRQRVRVRVRQMPRKMMTAIRDCAMRCRAPARMSLSPRWRHAGITANDNAIPRYATELPYDVFPSPSRSAFLSASTAAYAIIAAKHNAAPCRRLRPGDACPHDIDRHATRRAL
jgi:hypothetical protein